MKKKTSVILSMLLVFTVLVGGTIAYLTSKTDTVTNTFTVGNINITLAETTGENYKMVPGNQLAKDPKVTVKAGSEASWLFVKVQKSDNFDKFISYEMDADWKALDGVTGVYYREVAATSSDDVFSVLKDNKVKVKSDVTKAMMDDITNNTASHPTISFTAYAVQKDNVADAATAWDQVKNM